MAAILDMVIAVVIVLGGGFALVGSWGLARLPSLMSRLHGPTKATTLGVGGSLIASMLYFPSHGFSWSAHELLITLFLFITAPISANMIAKACLHGRSVAGGAAGAHEIPLPQPPHARAEWATFGSAEAAEEEHINRD